MKFEFMVRTKEDLIEAVQTFGFVPLFSNSIPGFSVEEHTAPEVWFTDQEGVWEWKGPVIRETGCAYGKFFEKKAAFVSRDWFPDLANWRRDGYDFDARYEDGLAAYQDKLLYDQLEANAPLLSSRLKQLGDFRRGGRRGFDGIMTRLQEQCYALICDFVYQTDRFGRQYGWGVGVYSTPEQHLGADFSRAVYQREPEESRDLVLERLSALCPGTPMEKLRRFLR